MGQAQVKLREPPQASAAPRHTSPRALAPLPKPAQMAAFLAVAQEGSFSAAAERLGIGQPAISKRVRAFEEVLGARLIERRGGALTALGRQTAATLDDHLTALARDLWSLKEAQPVLTVAVPGGQLGDVLKTMIEAFTHRHLGPLCLVPGWSSAAISFREKPSRGACEDIFLYADEWAVVAGPGWCGGTALEVAKLKSLPLVAVTPREHDAWNLLLEGERPSRLIRASRAEADAMIESGSALGIANIPLLRGAARAHLKPVSRRRVWPGTGLWLSLQDGTAAWDRGWSLATALKAEFGGESAA